MNRGWLLNARLPFQCQRSRQLAIAVSAIFSTCAQTRYLSEIKSEHTDGVNQEIAWEQDVNCGWFFIDLH